MANLVVSTVAIVALARGSQASRHFPLMITIIVYILCNMLHQVSVIWITRKTMNSIQNSDTKTVLRILCNISVVVLITHMCAFLRAVTDNELFDVAGLTIGSYTFILYGMSFTFYISAFVAIDFWWLDTATLFKAKQATGADTQSTEPKKCSSGYSKQKYLASSQHEDPRCSSYNAWTGVQQYNLSIPSEHQYMTLHPWFI